ncbi:MAG: copper chaperone PCu(A)C [Rubrimonas sp.]
MTRHAAPLLALALLPLLAAAPAPAQHGHGHGHGHGHAHDHGRGAAGDDHVAEGAGLRVLHGWTRAADGGEALVFAEISNVSGGMVRITGADSPAAAAAEIVGFQLIDGRESHAPVGAIDLGPDEAVTMAPFGLAVRLTGLRGPLRRGETLPLTLLTADGAVEIVVEVEAADARQHSHAGHNH